jgi:hypothetical protein
MLRASPLTSLALRLLVAVARLHARQRLSSLEMLVVPWPMDWFEQTRRRIVFGFNLVDGRSQVATAAVPPDAIGISKQIYMLRGC